MSLLQQAYSIGWIEKEKKKKLQTLKDFSPFFLIN